MHRTGTGPFPARPAGRAHSGYPGPVPEFSHPPRVGGAEPGSGQPEAVAALSGRLLRSQLEFGPLPGAIPCARLHARLVLREWGLASLGDPVELIVSELLTNALRAAPGGGGYPPAGRPQPIGLRLAADRQRVLVEVWDGSPAPPVAGGVSDEEETGRGLLMVSAMSLRWGYYYPAVGTVHPLAVKVVWALVGPAQAA